MTFSLHAILARLFPPRLRSLDQDGLKDVLAYHHRITRRGEDRNPAAYAGVKIVAVRETRAHSMPKYESSGVGIGYQFLERPSVYSGF